MQKRESEIKLTKEEFLDALCRVCFWPENPRLYCEELLNLGRHCEKCTTVAEVVCRKTSLENLTIFEER